MVGVHARSALRRSDAVLPPGPQGVGYNVRSMGHPNHLTRDISDTARWAAWCRSAEAQREAFRIMNAYMRLDRAPGASDGSTS